MRTVSPESSERNAHIDKAVGNLARALNDPRVQKSLGVLATVYLDIIETAFVPNIRNGNVDAPQSADSDALPIIAITHEESVTLDSFYHTQTRAQRVKTLSNFASWSPRFEPNDIYEAALSAPTPDKDSPRQGLSQSTVAKVGVGADVLSADAISKIFEDAPEGVAVITKRPVLILGIDDEESVFAPMTSHEVTHVRQYEMRPISFLKSQNNANMQALRSELEAARVGATVALPLLTADILTNDDSAESRAYAFNVGVDLARRDYRLRHGLVAGDPFEPSGGLLRELKADGFGYILHEAPDYEMISKLMLQKSADGDRTTC